MSDGENNDTKSDALLPKIKESMSIFIYSIDKYINSEVSYKSLGL